MTHDSVSEERAESKTYSIVSIWDGTVYESGFDTKSEAQTRLLEMSNGNDIGIEVRESASAPFLNGK